MLNIISLVYVCSLYMISYYFKRYEFARSVSDSGNNQHPFISASYNLQDTPVSSHEKQESSTTPSENVSQSPYFQSQPTVNNLCVQPDSSANLKTQPVHPTEISNDIVAYLLNKSLKERSVQPNENECIFYYQQQCNNRLYQVSCEIVSPLLVNNCLSKNFLGVEFQQNMEQEHIVLTFDQKEYLECHYLKKYLSQYLLG
ncbi:hypothetical protein RhiirB3_531097 [Rhizophagus irregularis]|nr:hypothetical protein RhiirB3_531097 [Rhizophagus irregularis]